MAQPDSSRAVRRGKKPRRTRKLRKRSWLAVFLILLSISGCALYSGQLGAGPGPVPPPGSLSLSAPAKELPALLARWPQLAEVFAGAKVEAVAAQHPDATIICAIGEQPWPAEIHCQTKACRQRLHAAADAIEQQYARNELYPAEACAVCPSGGKVSYKNLGEEFELTCTGAHHTTTYSSLTGFADEVPAPQPECAVAVLPPAPVYPWWSPSRYTAAPPAPQVVSGPANLIAVPSHPGHVELQVRTERALHWVPSELAGALRGCSHVAVTFDSAGHQGQLRAFGAPGLPAAGGDPCQWLTRLPESPVALAYERSFAHSLGLHLREPVCCDKTAGQLLDCFGRANPGWVALSAELELSDWRHERGRLCAGRCSAVGVSPETPVEGGGPDLQVQQAADHARVGLGQEPDAPALEWKALAALPGPAGAAGRVRSRELGQEVTWAAGRDHQGLWVLFTTSTTKAPPVATVPTQGPDVEEIYKRHLTVVAGR